ncbi:LCP family protein [Frigoribacterium sp. CG_9.8]|uniref:LCP family protein n=1 Tax=Frigoribacterium sp. CG_9.8 TaxID=2787733 RepID=UPI0018C98C9C|nr:LCP family protein [Frigoribacterium sp. CG_9.8]MBG6106734.1 LCP family protein required for cell wall assembly [Frigoribacterium sp. CG_9.8]
MAASSPIRTPDLRSRSTMTKRAWWLVTLNLLIPGSAQILAGNRRLGRFGVGATFLLWGLGISGLVVWFAAHTVILGLVTNPIGLTVIQVLLAGYAVLWIVLTLDTLRLARLVSALPAVRPVIAALSILALVATAGSAGYGAVSAGSARSAVSAIFAGTDMVPPAHGRYNILLLGGDAGPDRTGLRPDSTSVASIDATTGATTIIGIPRNMEQIQFAKGSPLYGPFPSGYVCGDQCLIDYLYTYGEEHKSLYPKAAASGSTPGIEAMKDAAEGVTGLTIQYYTLIDMQGFADLVDALGGVTIDVPAKLAYGPVTSTKPIGTFEAGPQVMSGTLALWYARSRFMGNDYERMSRQRDVQAAMLKQFQPATVLTKFQDIAKAGAQVVRTDIPTAALPGFVGLGEKAQNQAVKRLELVPPMFDGNRPDYDKIHAAVIAATSSTTGTPAP